ncbi:MAG TPA: abortive infection system antitoxin AbiGi family protein [Methanothrix sp.]|nr:abortive infection system antitoxin AbiGi family protein [Methanothrix sp.]
MDTKQRYVSKELTHFVGGNLSKETNDKSQLQEEQYKVLLKIIQEKCIRNPDWPDDRGTQYRINRKCKLSDNGMIYPGMICFCDIPLGDLGIHISKYSNFGLSFSKSFLIKKGANPVLYIAKNSAEGKVTKSEYYDIMADAFINSDLLNSPNNYGGKLAATADLMLHLLSHIKFFDSDKSEDDDENFYMEREWRSLHNIHFEIKDIRRIILPNSSFCERFRNDVPEYVGEITFSSGIA